MEANEKYEIPAVPTSNLDLNDKTGLINLAGWLVRYKNFGLKICEASPFVNELLKNGTLAQFEPSLAGLEVEQFGSDEEYERYEFDAKIKDFIDLGDDWAYLHFNFRSNSKCTMYIEGINQSGSNRLFDAQETIFNALGIDPLTEESSDRFITWEEADETILKYLKYMNNPEIPSVPK